MMITRWLILTTFFLLTNLKEELAGWECGVAKQEVQPLFELSLTQFSPSLFVVTSPYWEKCSPDSCFWCSSWTMRIPRGSDFLPWWSEQVMAFVWHWLTMTMAPSLALTSYPMLVWSVCTLTITMCSQVYPDYKGYRSLMSGSVWGAAPQGGYLWW